MSTAFSRPFARIAASVLAALLLAQAGCGGDGDEPGEMPPEEPEAPELGPAYVVGSRIRTPAGRTFYASLVPDLDVQTIDITESIELNGFARSFAHDGSLFLMDSETLEIARYTVGPTLDIELEARLSMAELGFRRFSVWFLFIDEDSALYVDFEQRQIVRWNPRTMTIESTVPIEGIEREGFVVQPAGVYLVGDRLLIPVGWTDVDPLRNNAIPVVGLIVADAQTGQTLGVFEDDRCGVAGGAVVRDNGDIYILGDSADGRYNVFGGVDKAPCLLRVRAGADGFDPDYYVNMREATGAQEMGVLVGLPDGTAVTRLFIDGFDVNTVENPLDLTLLEIYEWARFDIDTLETTRLDVPRTATTFPPDAFDEQIFVQREGEDGSSTLYVVDDESARESVSVQGELLQVGRIR